MNSQTNENSSDSKLNLIPVYSKIILSLENCLLPKEKLENAPSIVDGLDPDTEFDLRVIGCELIQTAGILLRLPQVAMATGQVLFQRFYYCKSFVRHPMEITAMGCVCLASKIEEAPRRVRDVINVFNHIKQVRYQKPITPLILDQQYSNLKIQVIKAERRILKELGFCVHVKHPHKLIVCYAQVLMLQENHRVMQTAWNYMNDSLRTDVFLRYSPETIACACIYLTCRKLKVTLPKNPAWFELFNINEIDILDVCKRIITLYHKPKIDPDVLENRVEKLKRNFSDDRERLRNVTNIVSNNNTPNNSPLSSTINRTKSPVPNNRQLLTPNHHKSPISNHHHKSPKSNNHRDSPKLNHRKSPKRNSRKSPAPIQYKSPIPNIDQSPSLNHKLKLSTSLSSSKSTIVKLNRSRLRDELSRLSPRSSKHKKKSHSNHGSSYRKRSRSRLRSESPKNRKSRKCRWE